MQIVRTPRYVKELRKLGAKDDEIRSLEGAIAANPLVGDVIPGLRGVRKVRFGIGARGKRGGGRAIYYLVVRESVAIMIFAYSKAKQDDLSNEQRKAALELVERMENAQKKR